MWDPVASCTTIVDELVKREVTILFATHLPAEAEGVLTHAAFIRDGKIVRTGTLDVLKREQAEKGGDASLEHAALSVWGEEDHVS